MRVPVADLRRQYRSLRAELEAAVGAVLASGRYILGEQVRAFEAEVAAYLGVRHAVGVASGTDALLLALRALGVGPGDEVVTTPFSFFGTVEAISLAGARPVFADVDPATLNLDPDAAGRAVTRRTRALLPVHLYGRPAEMAPLLDLAARRGLRVVEDACQAIGAAYRGRRAGGLGDAGCFSFFPTKNLGACGDGGLVATDDGDLAARVRLLRNHGSEAKYVHERVGYNSRLDELQAAILRVKLRHLEAWTEARREAAARYDRLLRETGLAGGPAEAAPPATAGEPAIVLPAAPDRVRHVYHQYTVRARDRDGLQRHLRERGVETAVHYPGPLHLQAACRELGYPPGSFPVAEAASAQVLSLPLFPEITPEEQEYVVEAIAGFYRGR